MPAGLTVVLVLATAGAALIAGAFWVFSVMVIPGLRGTDARTAVAAMQAVNVAALRPPFLSVFLGTAAAAVAAAIWAVVAPVPQTPWIVAGAACYLVGAIAVTSARNVPLNDGLAAVDAESAEAAREAWSRFPSRWARWNHVRAVGTLLAAACLVAALA